MSRTGAAAGCFIVVMLAGLGPLEGIGFEGMLFFLIMGVAFLLLSD